jgi:porin
LARHWRLGTFSSEPESSRGKDGVYAFVERRLTQESGSPEQGLSGLVRLGFADPRVNPVTSYFGGGFTYTGPCEGSDEDQVGLAIGRPSLARRPVAAPHSVGPAEARAVIIEAAYRAPLRPWLTLQPNVQFVIGPRGWAATSNALILGLRAELGF